MYRVMFKLTPWPRGGMYISVIDEVRFEAREYDIETNDDRMKRSANEERLKIRKAMRLEKCEVMHITETLTRHVPLE